MHGEEVLLFKSKEIIMHLEKLKTLSPLSSPHLSPSVKTEFTASNHSSILASLQVVINLASPANELLSSKILRIDAVVNPLVLRGPNLRKEKKSLP